MSIANIQTDTELYERNVEIYQMWQCGSSQRQLAERYGIVKSRVYYVLSRIRKLQQSDVFLHSYLPPSWRKYCKALRIPSLCYPTYVAYVNYDRDKEVTTRYFDFIKNTDLFMENYLRGKAGYHLRDAKVLLYSSLERIMAPSPGMINQFR